MEQALDTITLGRWATALSSDDAAAREARTGLAAAYWYPVYAFFRAGGEDGDGAASRTETVLSRLIDEPAGDAPLLREWMLGLALAEVADPAPRDPLLTIDRASAGQRFSTEGTHSPTDTFVRRWTLDLLEQTVATLQAEYEAAGKSHVFDALQPFLGYSGGGTDGGEPYAELADTLGVNDSAGRSMVFEFRRRYRELLLAALADTVATQEQITDELQSLLINLPAPAQTVAALPVLRRLDPEQLLARGMNSIQMSTGGALGWTPPTVAEAARLFPGYEVVGMLGHGGMGAVYQARQQSLDRLVALKLLPLEISVDPSFADRFRREARAMAKLNHPNIISVFDFGQTSEGHLFFAMEFVEGAMLHDLVHKRKGGLPPADALAIIEQVCEALSYAHEQGIVHRDIKPANVMIDPRGRAKIADFGLARLSDPATAEQWGQTMTGVIMGTPDYMSPEQKRGTHVDHRADIYSVGVMFYEMLCGETPQGAFELPSQRCGLPKELDTVITRAIAPQPEKRFQTTAEFKQAVVTVKPSVLKAAAKRSHTIARKPGAAPAVPIVTAAPDAARNPLVLWGSIAAAVVVLGAVAVFVLGKGKSKPAPIASAPSQAAANPAAEKPKAEPQTAASKPPAASPTPALKPSEPKPAPAPALVAAGNEKWVDGLAQWFGGTKTNDDFVRQANGAAKAGRKNSTIVPLLASVPLFRDQAARVRTRLPTWADDDDLRLSVRSEVDSKKRCYTLMPHPQQQRLVLTISNTQDPSERFTSYLPLPADFDYAAVHTLELRVVGDLLTAWVDGKKLGEKRDTRITAGHPSVLVKNMTIESFEYANLDPAAPAPALAAAKPAAASPIAAAAPQPASSTKVAPVSLAPAFENTLGMKFVPVPITGGPTNGQRVLFSIWDTRVQDYRVFAEETKREWPKPDFEQGPTHPAVNVSWEDAQAFCAWLTARERKVGKLGANELYRLPSDHEWSCAVGIGDQEDAAKLPSEKDKKINGVYPWGTQWPPPKGAGNYPGEELRSALAGGTYANNVLAGYDDGFVNTSPVDSFAANRFGLYDLGGNVVQWCEDWLDASQKNRVQRGSTWMYLVRSKLLLSSRDSAAPGNRGNRIFGFRVVLMPGAGSLVGTVAASAPKAEAASTPPPPAPAKPESEMEKWLAQVDGPQQESYQRDVMKPFEAGLAELQKSYVTAMESRTAAASTAGQLGVALGWRNELQRFRDTAQTVPAEDADLTTVAAPFVAKSLPPLRAQFRTQKAKLDADRLSRAKVAFGKYDAILSPGITQLTQRQRLDDALLLKTKRDEVQKAWMPEAPAPAAPAPGPPSTPAPKPFGSRTTATPTPAPNSKAATPAAIRAAAEWVIAHGGQVEVPGKKIAKAEDLPAGSLALSAVTFHLKDGIATETELHALKALGAITNVKVDWDAPDSTLTFLQAFGNVGLLQFVRCPKITDALLEALPPMPNLGKLSLTYCQGITGTGLAKLKAPKLTDIDLTGDPITDEGVKALSQHEGVRKVWLEGSAITDAGVLHLERLRGLTYLQLLNTSATPASLTFLAKRKEFTELEYLNAAAPDFVVNAQAIAKIVPHLPSLRVRGKASGPEATRALLGFKSLRSLYWAGSEMNDATFGELAALTDLENLVCGNSNLTDAAMDTVLALKKLLTINVTDSRELTDAGLLKLKPLKKLKTVYFSRTKVTDAGAAALEKAIPGVKVFR